MNENFCPPPEGAWESAAVCKCGEHGQGQGKRLFLRRECTLMVLDQSKKSRLTQTLPVNTHICGRAYSTGGVKCSDQYISRRQLGQERICVPFCSSMKLCGGMEMLQPVQTPPDTGTMTG